MAKTWVQKMHNGREPEVETLDKPFGGLQPGARLLISTPLEVDSEVRSLPPGRSISVPELRARLAKKHGADGACPLTTSIFLRIVSEVALEELAAGKSKSDVTPFWRVVDPKSPIAKKLSCGPDEVAKLRSQEA